MTAKAKPKPKPGTRAAAGRKTAAKPAFHLKGVMLGACSCDWGCPCSFEAAPTQGYCEGGYLWHVKKGRYDGVDLDGLCFAWYAHSPAALHLGNVTSLYLVDERADEAQRRALEKMLTKDPEVMPFGIFASLTTTLVGIRYQPFELHLDGTRSRASAGAALRIALTPMTNPVTGEEEPATLLKPKGFTSKRQELCSTSAFTVHAKGLSYDHSGKYGEYCAFEYGAA